MIWRGVLFQEDYTVCDCPNHMQSSFLLFPCRTGWGIHVPIPEMIGIVCFSVYRTHEETDILDPAWKESLLDTQYRTGYFWQDHCDPHTNSLGINISILVFLLTCPSFFKPCMCWSNKGFTTGGENKDIGIKIMLFPSGL